MEYRTGPGSVDKRGSFSTGIVRNQWVGRDGVPRQTAQAVIPGREADPESRAAAVVAIRIDGARADRPAIWIPGSAGAAPG